MTINDITERRFYKFITKILTMSKEDAVKYIIDESISHPSLTEHARNYLLYNPDSTKEEVLQETANFLKEVEALHFDTIRGTTKEERKQKGKESRKNTIERNTRRLEQEVYIKNRYLLEEYVDSEGYIYTILNKYNKNYDFFMSLVNTASTCEDIYDKMLYKQVNELLISKENNVNLAIEKIAPLVLGYIQEGIKVGNELVPFTIFDYYANFGVPIDYFFSYNGEKIKENELNEIRMFFKKIILN